MMSKFESKHGHLWYLLFSISPKRIEGVNVAECDPHSASADCSFQTPEAETPSPEPRDEEPDVTQRTAGEERLEKRLDSSKQLTTDDKKAKNNNNNNMLACKLPFLPK